MKILMVEDDQFKSRALTSFFEHFYTRAVEITHARSVASAVKAIGVGGTEYELVCLDMSLPTFDIGGSESGGRPQGFGGSNVLRELTSEGLTAKVIVVTQFEEFQTVDGSMRIEDLGRSLKLEFPDNFVGWVYFEHGSDAWRVELTKVLKGLVFDGDKHSFD